jgi:hypothetical protein
VRIARFISTQRRLHTAVAVSSDKSFTSLNTLARFTFGILWRVGSALR